MPVPLSLLTDYGVADEFAGVLRGVVARIAPDVRVIDVTHGIPRGDVAGGSLALARALPYLPPGVHVAVVDPGVGGPRRAVALRTIGEGRILVGPDNGLLLPAAERDGGVAAAVEISASPWRLEPMSATFHGRDLFAPVGAQLAAGGALEEAGVRLDPTTLVAPELPRAELREDALHATVISVDGFGNVALLASERDLEALGAEAVHVGPLDATVARTFADVPPGDAVVHVDSGGHVAVAINGGDAAAALGVGPGDRVILLRA